MTEHSIQQASDAGVDLRGVCDSLEMLSQRSIDSWPRQTRMLSGEQVSSSNRVAHQAARPRPVCDEY